jgi:hypothetical protein
MFEKRDIYINIYSYTIYIAIQYIFVNNTIYILLQFNALKHQLSTQSYESSTTSHMVRKLLTVVVAFGATIPIILQLLRCLDASDVWTSG